jgi:2-succinyl-6-hydroxy-2,4-cyclohexadiene-1-carboxylate synthase
MLCELMSEVAPGPAVWAGYSMGGRLALSAAASGGADPVALILESSSPGLADAGARRARMQADEEWASLLEAGDLGAFVDAWMKQPVFESQDRLPRLIRDSERARRLEGDPLSLAASLRGFGAGRQPSWWDALETVECPVLLLNGALDEKFDAVADEMARLLPDARRARVRGAGHAIHLEKPEAWLAEVTPFLERVRYTGA